MINTLLTLRKGFSIRVIQNNAIQEGEAVLFVNENDYNRIKEKYGTVQSTKSNEKVEPIQTETELSDNFQQSI